MSHITFSDWLTDLRALFPIADECRLAEAIYQFEVDFDEGLSPRASYERFDRWSACGEVA